jgi:hypothetical protein
MIYKRGANPGLNPGFGVLRCGPRASGPLEEGDSRPGVEEAGVNRGGHVYYWSTHVGVGGEPGLNPGFSVLKCGL